MSGKTFISYRRDDSPASAGRLYDRLTTHFDRTLVFMDVDALEPGTDFVEAIERFVGSCDVLIAVIGNRWLTSSDPEGRRRLDTPEDFVRLEIATALKRNIRVIPVLVEGATMPRASELPDDLQLLVRRNAVEVSHNRFDSDSERLIGAIKRALEGAKIEHEAAEPAAKARIALEEGEPKPTLEEANLREPEPLVGVKEKPCSSQVLQPALFSILSGLPPRSEAIRSPTIVVGRDPSADLVLGHPAISRKHCYIFHEGGTWFIEDLLSRRGTMVNGKRIAERTQIHEGDKIRVGPVTLVFGERRVEYGGTPFFVEPPEQHKRQVTDQIQARRSESFDMPRPPKRSRSSLQIGRIVTALIEPVRTIILFFVILVTLVSLYGILIQLLAPVQYLFKSYPHQEYIWFDIWSWLPGPVLFLSKPAGLGMVLCLAVSFWCGVSWLLARFSGWRRIFSAYPAPNRLQGAQKFRSVVGYVGLARYHLTAYVTEEGLRLSVFFVYRFGHPAIFIPWTAIYRIESQSLASSQYVSFEVGSPSIATIRLPHGVSAGPTGFLSIA